LEDKFMPLYEFACQQCAHTYEELVLHDEAVECPKCQGRQVERLLSVPAPPVVKVQCPSLPVSCNPRAPECGQGCCKLS
jgi:putative FmdB family regulatory protein